jgi:putative oxidoreductase
MADLRLVHEERERGMGEWLARGCVALPFLIFGLEKFGNDAHWVQMFREIGWGVRFRYFAGAVEVLGAVLVMVPRLALAGLGLLACTMAAAVVIVAAVLHRPGDSLFPGVFLITVCAVGWWWRRG